MGTNTGTIMTISNSIIGVSVLAMPFCFKECGIVLSILLLIMSSIVSRLTCYLLLKSAVMARRRNFEFLAFHIFGPTGKFVAELCIIGFLMGTCIAFFVVVGDLGPAILSKLLDIGNTAALRPSVLIGLAVLVVLPLGLLRNVDSLSSICTATIGFYVCLVMKVVLEALPQLMSGVWLEKVEFWRPEGVLQCLPIFSMALFCQTQLFEIYDSLPNPSLERMNAAVRAAINLCTGVYIAVGFFGYIAFCTQTFGGNILMSFAPTIMSDVFKLGFVLSVAVSFPLVIFPCRASLYSLLYRRSQTPHHEMVASFIPEARFKCITVFIIGVSLAIGLVIPNIELVLGLVGSTIGVGICVIFPALAFIFVSTKETTERIVAQFLLFVGILVLVLGSYANLYAANDTVKQVAVLPTIVMRLPTVRVPQLAAELNAVKEPPVPKEPPVRKEPPVPMEPAESVNAKKKPAVPMEQVVKVEEEKKVPPEVKKKSEEVIDKDALKKEDEELADAEKQASVDANQKNAELLRKLEKHQEEQKKLLQEQKEILQELKEQKIEDAKEKEVVMKEKEVVESAKELKVDTRQLAEKNAGPVVQPEEPEVAAGNSQVKPVSENEAVDKQIVVPFKSSKEPIAYQQRYLNGGPASKNMTVKTLIMPPAAAPIPVVKEQQDVRSEIDKINALDILKQGVLNNAVDEAKVMRRDILGTEDHDREKREADKKADILKLVKKPQLQDSILIVKDGNVSEETVPGEANAVNDASQADTVNISVPIRDEVNNDRGDGVIKTADISILGEVNELQAKKEENCAKPENNRVDGNQSKPMNVEMIKVTSRLTDPLVPSSDNVEVVEGQMDVADEMKPMSRDLKWVGSGKKDDRGQKSR